MGVIMRWALVFAMFLFSRCSWLSEEKKEVHLEEKALVAAAGAESCAKAFEETIHQLQSGSQFLPIYSFYKDHFHCMDGAYAEGMEGAISESLNKKWSQLPELSRLFRDDPKFKSFFFGNIGCFVSGTEDHLEAVVKKSKNSCPKNLESLCSEIRAETKKALAYSKSQ